MNMRQRFSEMHSVRKEKRKKFVRDFQKFAFQSSALELAVGVVIAGLLREIVNALIANFITPLIGLVMEKNLETYGFTLTSPDTGEVLAFFGVGPFIASLVNFVITAFLLFCALRLVHRVASAWKKTLAETENEKAPEEHKPTQEELLTGILEQLTALNAAIAARNEAADNGPEAE